MGLSGLRNMGGFSYCPLGRGAPQEDAFKPTHIAQTTGHRPGTLTHFFSEVAFCFFLGPPALRGSGSGSGLLVSSENMVLGPFRPDPGGTVFLIFDLGFNTPIKTSLKPYASLINILLKPFLNLTKTSICFFFK